MKFSIVTPAYNADRYVGEMIASVRRQSLYDWELRIVDDGSTDGTRSIIEREAMTDPRIKPIYLDENSGSDFLPRRIAIEQSEGEYVVNIDADDTVEKDYLYKLDDRIRNTGADIVYADMYLTGLDKDPFKAFPRAEEDIYHDVYDGMALMNMALDEWRISGVSATRKALALKSLELYDYEMASEPYWNSFDNENLTRMDLAMAEKVAFSNARYFYRQVPDSVTHKMSERRFGLLSADIRLCEFTEKYFGRGSKEDILANRQLLHHVVEFMRILNSPSDLRPSRQARILTSKAYRRIDLQTVKGAVSPRFWKLMHLGFPLSKLILKMYEKRDG